MAASVKVSQSSHISRMERYTIQCLRKAMLHLAGAAAEAISHTGNSQHSEENALTDMLVDYAQLQYSNLVCDQRLFF